MSEARQQHTKKIRLPETEYGEGTFTWKNEEHTKMRYRIQYFCEADQRTYRLSVTASCARECRQLMEEKKKVFEKEKAQEIKYTSANKHVVLSDAMYEWVRNKKYDKKKSTGSRGRSGIRSRNMIWAICRSEKSEQKI